MSMYKKFKAYKIWYTKHKIVGDYIFYCCFSVHFSIMFLRDTMFEYIQSSDTILILDGIAYLFLIGVVFAQIFEISDLKSWRYNEEIKKQSSVFPSSFFRISIIG